MKRVSMTPYQDSRLLIYDVTQSYLQTEATRSSETSICPYMYIWFFLTMPPVARSVQLRMFWCIIIWKGRGRKWYCPFGGTRLVCTRGSEKTLNNCNHDRRCPGRNSNRGLPNTEHECCRICAVVPGRINSYLSPSPNLGLQHPITWCLVATRALQH